MRKKYLWPFLILLLLFFSATRLPYAQEKTQTRADYSEALRLINVWLEAQRDYEQLPGMSAAIVDNQEVIFAQGYGPVSYTHLTLPTNREV